MRPSVADTAQRFIWRHRRGIDRFVLGLACMSVIFNVAAVIRGRSLLYYGFWLAVNLWVIVILGSDIRRDRRRG